MIISLEPHPVARIAAFTTRFHVPLGETPATALAALGALLRMDADAPLARDEAVRQAVRDMLRHGGYKPTGRGKPAAEYLVRAVEADALASINAAVDACNVVSLHSGLPISVVDTELVQPPLRIATGGEGESYAFNPAGQEIDVSGLLCLHDAGGPCANAVKDAQRTKTRPETTRTWSVVGGVAAHETRLDAAEAWYRELLAGVGAVTEAVELLAE
jgi:DNA/RNA-binding domain of Phe-tRNA-synthetase-like protein